MAVDNNFNVKVPLDPATPPGSNQVVIWKPESGSFQLTGSYGSGGSGGGNQNLQEVTDIGNTTTTSSRFLFNQNHQYGNPLTSQNATSGFYVDSGDTQSLAYTHVTPQPPLNRVGILSIPVDGTGQVQAYPNNYITIGGVSISDGGDTTHDPPSACIGKVINITDSNFNLTFANATVNDVLHILSNDLPPGFFSTNDEVILVPPNLPLTNTTNFLKATFQGIVAGYPQFIINAVTWDSTTTGDPAGAWCFYLASRTTRTLTIGDQNTLSQIELRSTASDSTDPRSGLLLTSSPNIYFFQYDAKTTSSGSLQPASASAQIGFDQKDGSLAFKVSGTASAESPLKTMLFISKSGDNARIGIGVKDPKSSLDIKDVEDNEAGTRFLLTSARTDALGAQVGDSAGQIFFSIDSGSYNDPFTTGSVAALKTIITSLETTGSGQSSNNSSGLFRIDASPINNNELYNIVQIGFFTGSHVDYQGQETGASATVHISGSLIIHPNPDDTGQQQGDIIPFEIWNRPTVSTGVESLQLYLTGSNLVLTTGSFTAKKITGSVEVVAGDLRLSSNTVSSTLDSDVYFTIATNGIGFEANTGDTFQFNSVQNNVDFILSGENEQNLLFGDASTDRIGIGTNTPNSKFEVVGDTILSGSLAISQSFTASGLNYPDTDGTDGQVVTTDGAGNLSFQTIEDVYVTVKNVSGGTLAKGTPVHATSSQASGNATPVIAASASDASTMPATFVLNEQIADEAEGQALLSGFIQGVNTSLFEVGEVVYVGENGGFTNVKPTSSNNLIQNLGIVTKIHASNGSGWIYGSGRSNDVPNLPTGKIWVGSDSYTVTSSVISLDETNKYVSGSESAKFKLDTYAFGYNTFPGFGFDVTGSGIIVSSSLPDEHYPMIKIGETELLDLTTDTALTNHTFTIHNVDNFQVTSGSEPTDVSTNKLFEHTGNAFNVYTNGSTTKIIDASSTSVKFGATDLYLTPSSTTYLKASSTSDAQYVAVWNSEPNVAGTGAPLKYITASTFTGGGGGSSTLAGLSDVSITSITDGDLLRYNGTAAEWQNTNLGLTVTPIISFASESFAAGEITITNSASYDDLSIFCQIKSGSTVVVPNSSMSFDEATGKITYIDTGTEASRSIELKVQDFGDLQSEIVTGSYLKKTANFRYWRLIYDSQTSSTHTYLRNFRLYGDVNRGGTAYPSNMTSNTAPTPYSASGNHLFNSTYDYFKAFDSSINTGWWTLGSTTAGKFINIDLGTAQTINSVLVQFNQSFFAVDKFSVIGSNNADYSDSVDFVTEASAVTTTTPLLKITIT